MKKSQHVLLQLSDLYWDLRKHLCLHLMSRHVQQLTDATIVYHLHKTPVSWDTTYLWCISA